MAKFRALAMCASLGVCAGTTAAPLPGRNLDFAAWSAAGAPEGWGFSPTPGYRIERDCASAPSGLPCAIRIEGKPTSSSSQPLGQAIAPGSSLGAGALLTGWVRTQDVVGQAALWLRVDGEGGRMFKLDNMGERGVKGTQGWSRVSVQVPVAGNAHMLAFGVMLSGSGTAWFADLRLTSDESVKTPPYDGRAK